MAKQEMVTLTSRPYRTLENVIEGAVLTFFDVTETKKAREALRDSETLHRLAVVVRTRTTPSRCRTGGPHPGLESGGGKDVRLERSRGAGDEHPRPDPGEPARRSVDHREAACPG